MFPNKAGAVTGAAKGGPNARGLERTRGFFRNLRETYDRGEQK